MRIQATAESLQLQQNVLLCKRPLKKVNGVGLQISLELYDLFRCLLLAMTLMTMQTKCIGKNKKQIQYVNCI